MRKAFLGLVVIAISLSIPMGREALACNECASAYGVVGCRYRFFYGALSCSAYSVPGGFRCVLSGACDEVGPPDPGQPKEPFNQDDGGGMWVDSRPSVQLPEESFALLPGMGLGQDLRGF